MDTLSPERRSWNMRRIKGRNTGPERIVRSILHRMGYRFSLHRKDLPGKPDIVLMKHKTVVFVHGCFWHSCPEHFKLPATNQSFWKKKLQDNKARDSRQIRQIRALGWTVIRIWGHALKTEAGIRKTARMVKRALRPVV